MVAISLSEIDRLVEQYAIPAQPQVLLDLQQELNTTKPDYSKIMQLVKNDISLSAKILQVANTQLLAINRAVPPFTCVENAVELIGRYSLASVISTMQGQQLIDHADVTAELFWHSTSDIAILSAYLAQRLVVVDANKAQLLGLFRDSGMTIMYQAFPNYKEAVKKAKHETIAAIEEQAFGINHQLLSYRLCLELNLPEVVRWAVLNHHDVEPPLASDSSLITEKKALIATVTMAERISMQFRKMMTGYSLRNWKVLSPSTLEVLDISEQDATDLMESTLELMEELLRMNYK